MKDRTKLIELFTKLDDEAFSWLVLACMPSAMTSNHGHKAALTQIWPDGCGGFQDRKTIEEIRDEAKKYCDL